MIRGGNIGQMDTFLTIQEPTETRDLVTNEVLITWDDFADVWAEKMRDPESEERIEASQQVARTKSVFRIRYLVGLTETMRMVRDGVYNYILGIEERDRKKFLIVTTERRDNV